MSKRLTEEEVLCRFADAHCDTYDYSRMVYVGKGYKIIIGCPIHGWFEQRAGDHMAGHGCKKCSNEKLSIIKTKDNDKFIKDAIIVHGNLYGYAHTKYIEALGQVIITCSIHGDFTQRANDHLNGSGCSDCNKCGFSPSLPAILYYIKDTETGFYKTGITNRTTEERYGTRMKRIDIIHEEEFNLGKDAFNKEQSILEEFSEYRITNEDFGDGKTEFFSRDILNLDS